MSTTAMRLLRHLIYPRAWARRMFPRAARRAIADAVAQAETRHASEIRVAIEAALEPHEVLRGITARRRAQDLFGRLRVWDTAERDGVLIYLLLAEHSVEIVADRGIAAKVSPQDWQAVCDAMGALLHEGHPLAAVLDGVARVADLLAPHSPATPGRARRLSDWPVLVGR